MDILSKHITQPYTYNKRTELDRAKINLIKDITQASYKKSVNDMMNNFKR